MAIEASSSSDDATAGTCAETIDDGAAAVAPAARSRRAQRTGSMPAAAAPATSHVLVVADEDRVRGAATPSWRATSGETSRIRLAPPGADASPRTPTASTSGAQAERRDLARLDDAQAVGQHTQAPAVGAQRSQARRDGRQADAGAARGSESRRPVPASQSRGQFELGQTRLQFAAAAAPRVRRASARKPEPHGRDRRDPTRCRATARKPLQLEAPIRVERVVEVEDDRARITPHDGLLRN